MHTEKLVSSESLDAHKVQRIVNRCIRAFKTRPKATQQEILIALANLIYSIGASIDGYKGKGPPLEELKKMYYANPTVGISLMLQSMLMSVWAEDIDKVNKNETAP